MVNCGGNLTLDLAGMSQTSDPKADLLPAQRIQRHRRRRHITLVSSIAVCSDYRIYRQLIAWVADNFGSACMQFLSTTV